MNLLKTQPTAEVLLSQAQSGRELIQDFCPLGTSLEWHLGQQYFRSRGTKAFISDSTPVPFVINNDGTLSRNAAEVFFANLVQAEDAGTSEEDIFVLELGIGVGLFARYFLDSFRDLCFRHDKDYYGRLTYIAGDYSERILHDLLQHGILADHAGHYRVRLVDAMHPDKYLPRDVAFRNRPAVQPPFRAVFLNYVLDCLPVAVLEFDGDEVRQLCVRTCVARNVNLADYTDLTHEQLQERAKQVAIGEWPLGADPRQDLLEVYGLFASEYDYRPVDPKTIPHGEFAVTYGRPRTKRLLLNYGAVQSMEKLLDLVHNEGFLLINDYGQTQITLNDEFEHQRFSLATAVGLNFPLLKNYFGETRSYDWLEPVGEDRGIHARLLSKQVSSAVSLRFQEVFGQPAHEKREDPLKKARECLRVGRFELATTYYTQALQLQPRNWVLMNEISMFLTFQLRDPKAGMDMAKLALELNPTCSAELWNTLGDGLYEFGRTAEARAAYEKALTVNDSDVRARYNLAWVHTREKDHAAALQMLAEALALDKTGEYRDRILQKQQEVLAQLTVRNQQEYLLLINLVSKYAKGNEERDNKEESSPPRMVPEHTA